MVKDPYSVLGISRNASQDEIKKAYRKMARKYHPDMHPDDPDAARKMNEINEAYDMLTNPEKYEKERAREQAQEQYRSQSGYGSNGYYSSNGYNSYGGSGYYGSNSGDNGYYRNSGGYYGNFYDFFGGGYGSRGYTGSINPSIQPGDSREIQRTVNLINTGKYQAALSLLGSIPSSGRDARWYYMCALAYFGGKDMTHANDYIQKACQMDPDNQTYQNVLSKVTLNARSRESYTYSTRSTGRSFLIRMIIPIIIMFLFYSVIFRGCLGGYSGYYNGGYYGYPYYYENSDSAGSNTNP